MRGLKQVGFLLLLATGLLTAQLCSAICGELENTQALATSAPVTEPTKHCHEAPPSSDPQPSSHSCVGHNIAMEEASAASLGNQLGHLAGPSDATLPIRLTLAMSRPPVEGARFSSLRSPPRTPQRQILRI